MAETKELAQHHDLPTFKVSIVFKYLKMRHKRINSFVTHFFIIADLNKLCSVKFISKFHKFITYKINFASYLSLLKKNEFAYF
jgi:hypothetical protein